MKQGERDLGTLLEGLKPELSAERYAFEQATETALDADCFALVREVEALTAVRTRSNGEWARITIGVHSSLEAVGLTAILASRLADAGISANVIAALYHDHIFVPWNRRHEALSALQRNRG